MSAECTALADSIIEALNAHDFSIPFAADRPANWKPNCELAAVAEALRVIVIPSGETQRRIDRDTREIDYSIDVAIVKGLSVEPSFSDDCDKLMGLMQELYDFLFSLELPGRNESWESAEVDYPDEQQLQQFKFVGVIRPVFRGHR